MTMGRVQEWASDDPLDSESGQRYLDQLRYGTDDQKVAARNGLARVFEERGMLPEATELYERNVRAGIRDRALHLQLASLYRRQGLFDLADRALADSVYAQTTGAFSSANRDSAGGSADGRLPQTAPSRRPGIVLWGMLALLLVGGLVAAAWSLRSPSIVAQDAVTPRTALIVQATPGPTTAPDLVTPTGLAPAASPNQATPEATQVAGCRFVLGFAELRQTIGAEAVGDCVEDQASTENGDARQPTTKGELIWRKADNRSAFTNGNDTWIAGPNGVEKRLNSERFAWEPDGPRSARSAAPVFPRPPVLPGSVLPNRRIISYYGNPLSTAMGILGETPPPQMLERLKQQTAAYAAADPSKPVQAALELIAIVAQEGAGNDGLYRLRMDTDLIEEVIELAESNNMLVILDIQIGWSKVAPEIRSLLPFLKRPSVHLALDPEFAMRPGEKPGEHIGTHDAADVNQAIDILAELVTAENLPPKMLMVHRFTEKMLTNYKNIKADSRVQVVVVMDGFGSPNLKTKHYNEFVRDQPVQYTGFKLFYKQDKPIMTPREVADLDPSPDLIIYQ